MVANLMESPSLESFALAKDCEPDTLCALQILAVHSEGLFCLAITSRFDFL